MTDTTQQTLPPLPRPNRNAWPDGWHDLFSEHQMREYALAALAQQQAHGVPEGWKLVPIHPTWEMCTTPWNVSMSEAHTDDGVSAAVWRAMLSAAPPVPEQFKGNAIPLTPGEDKLKEADQFRDATKMVEPARQISDEEIEDLASTYGTRFVNDEDDSVSYEFSDGMMYEFARALLAAQKGEK